MLSLAQSSDVMSFVADSRLALHTTHEETRNIGADNAVKLGFRHQDKITWLEQENKNWLGLGKYNCLG